MVMDYIMKNLIGINLKKMKMSVPQAYRIISKYDQSSYDLGKKLMDWDETSDNVAGHWNLGTVDRLANRLFAMMTDSEKSADLREVEIELDRL